MSTALQQQDPAIAGAAIEFATPAQAVTLAMQRGDLDQVAKFMDLKERHDQNEARKAYVQAMALFKQNPPEILKGKLVGYVNKDGSTTGYKHATLADVCTAAIKGLADVGISHSWDTKQEGGRVTVTCTLTHAMGHRESTSLTGGLDDSGKKNPLQQLGSTITYLQRYTLKMITGLAEADDDDDGRAAAEPVALLDENQAANIDALLAEIGANRAAFLRWARVEKISDIPAANYLTVVREIEARRAK